MFGMSNSTPLHEDLIARHIGLCCHAVRTCMLPTAQLALLHSLLTTSAGQRRGSAEVERPYLMGSRMKDMRIVRQSGLEHEPHGFFCDWFATGAGAATGCSSVFVSCRHQSAQHIIKLKGPQATDKGCSRGPGGEYQCKRYELLCHPNQKNAVTKKLVTST